MAQYKSFFNGTDPVENAEGAVEMGGFDNPPNPGISNQYDGESNPSIVGWHDIADAAQFRTNDDDVAGSHKGQGGMAANRSLLKPPIG